MAGHSKWANIQHRKGKQDARRGKLFTKLIREITVAARMGGIDSGSNPRLRAAIDEALTNNMTRDTIDRAVKRGTGADQSEQLEEVRYEGYGPGGTAVLVDCLTDNRNRTVGEIRHAFAKAGGNLGQDGSVSYLFSKAGILSYAPGAPEDRLMEVSIEAGAADVIAHDDGSLDVLTTPEDFGHVLDALRAAGLAPAAAEVTMRAMTQAALAGEHAEKMLRLLDLLEDLDDVQKVYSNADIADEVLAKFG